MTHPCKGRHLYGRKVYITTSFVMLASTSADSIPLYTERGVARQARYSNKSNILGGNLEVNGCSAHSYENGSIISNNIVAMYQGDGVGFC